MLPRPIFGDADSASSADALKKTMTADRHESPMMMRASRFRFFGHLPAVTKQDRGEIAELGLAFASKAVVRVIARDLGVFGLDPIEHDRLAFVVPMAGFAENLDALDLKIEQHPKTLLVVADDDSTVACFRHYH